MGKYCSECGMKMDDDTLFCPGCGCPAESGESTVLSEPAESSSAPIPNEATVPEQAVPLTFDVPQITEQPEACSEFVDDAAVDVQTEDEKIQKKVKSKKWMIPVAAVLAVLVALAFLWQPLLLKISPNAYLSLATGNTMKALQKRSEDSPASLLGKTSEILKDGTVGLNVKYKGNMGDEAGEINASVNISSNKEDKKWAVGANLEATASAAMSVSISGGFDFYLDGKFAALSVDPITDSKYYGVTYSSFKNDFKKSAFGELLEDEQLNQIADVLDMLSEQINSDNDSEKVLEPYAKIIEEFNKNLPQTTGKDDLTMGDKSYKCTTITTEMDMGTLKDLLDQLLDELEDDKQVKEMMKPLLDLAVVKDDDAWDAMIDEIRDGLKEIEDTVDLNWETTYYIHSMKVVGIRIDMTFAADDMDDDIGIEIMTTFGADAQKDDLEIEAEITVDDQSVEAKILSSIEKEKDQYKETLKFSASSGEEEIEAKLVTNWNHKDGKLKIAVSGSSGDQEAFSVDFSLNLEKTEKGYILGIKDLRAFLVDIVPELEDEMPDFSCSITLEVSEGSNIKTPDYINLDKISQKTMEEFAKKLEDLDIDFGQNEAPELDNDEWSDDTWTDDEWPDDDFWAESVTPKIFDVSGVLTDTERTWLDETANSIASIYEYDPIVVITEGVGEDIIGYGTNFYNIGEYGIGDDKSGLILVLCSDTGDWAIVQFGGCLESFPDDKCREIMNTVCADTNEDGNWDYYTGIDTYLTQLILSYY